MTAPRGGADGPRGGAGDQRAAPGGEHPSIAETLNALGMTAQNLERLDEAGRYYDEALAVRRKVLGPTHVHTAATRNNLAALYYQQSDFEKAAPIFRENVELQRQTLGDDHPSVATSRNNLGVVLLMLGDLEAAEPEYREALRIRLRTYGEEHRSVSVTRYHLGRLLRDRGEPVEAEALMRRALEGLPDGDSNRPACHVDLGELLLTQGRLDEAGSLLEDGVRLSTQIEGPDHWRTAAARSARGAWFLARGEHDAAEEDLEAAWEGLGRRPADDRRRRGTLQRLVELYRETGRQDEADEAERQLDES